MLGKITTLLAAFETVSGVNITRKMVMDLLLLIVLTIIGAVTAAAFALLCLYGIYLFLTLHGFTEIQALLIAGALMAIKLAVIIALIIRKVRRIQSIPLHVSTLGEKGLSSLQSILRGFYNGITKKE